VDRTSETDRSSAGSDEGLVAGDPTTTFLEALHVRRNGTIGAITGLLFAILVYVGFVAIPVSTTFPRSLYVPLIAVVAFGVAVLVATALSAIAAWRRIRNLNEH